MANRPHRPRGWLTHEEWENRDIGVQQVPTFGRDGKINGVALNLGTSRSGGSGFFGGTSGTRCGTIDE